MKKYIFNLTDKFLIYLSSERDMDNISLYNPKNKYIVKKERI